MPLKEFLVWLTTIGAAILTYELIEHVPKLAALEARTKRIVAYAMSAGFAILAWLAQVGMLYVPAPVGPRAWVEAIFAVGTVAFGLSTLIHTRDLPVVEPVQ
jgi:hypothetical protein